MIQVIAMCGPKSNNMAVETFFKAMKNEIPELVAASITMPDIFGYVTYLLQVSANEDEIGKAFARAVFPARWSTIDNETIEGFVWKACKDGIVETVKFEI